MEVTSYHFCHILLVSIKSPDQLTPEGTAQGHEFQDAGVVWNHLPRQKKVNMKGYVLALKNTSLPLSYPYQVIWPYLSWERGDAILRMPGERRNRVFAKAPVKTISCL